MSDLKDKIFAIFKGELDSIKHEFTDDLEPYLEDKAIRIAELEGKILTGSDEEKDRARASMKHQKAHISDEIFRQAIAKTERAKNILESIISTVIAVIIK